MSETPNSPYVAADAGADPFKFLTSHALVLLAVDPRPDATILELAREAGVTDRQVSRVLTDLEVDGYVPRTLVGRRNHYTVNRNRKRHDSLRGEEIGDLLAVLQ